MVGKINRNYIDNNLPWIIGASIFVLGFFSMFIFSLFYHGSEERDFWFYNAATYGDAISLPGMVISAGLYIRKAEKLIGDYKKKTHKIICHIVAAIAGVIGIGMQISWLIEARSNWTLLNRATDISFCGIRFTMVFTVAGWWHAAFFVIAMSTIAFWFCRLILIRVTLSHSFQSNCLMRILLYVFAFCSALYTELHFSDELDSRIYDNEYANNIIMWFVILFIIHYVLFIIVPLFCSSNKSIIVDTAPLFSGGLLAVSISDMILFHEFDWFIVVSSALLGLSISWLSYCNKDSVNLFESFESLLYTVFLYASLSNFCIAHGFQDSTWIIILIVVSIMIIWPIALYCLFKDKIHKYHESFYSEEAPELKVKNTVFNVYLWCPLVIAYGIIVNILNQENCVFSEAINCIRRYLSFPIIALAMVAIVYLFIPIKAMNNKPNISIEHKTSKIFQYVKILIFSLVCIIWFLKGMML